MSRNNLNRRSPPLFTVAILSMCLVAPSAFSEEESNAQHQTIASSEHVDDEAQDKAPVFVTEPVFKLETLLGTAQERK